MISIDNKISLDHLNRKLRSAAEEGHTGEARAIFEQMKDFEKASDYLNIMKKCGLTPNRYTANHWVDILIRTESYPEAKREFLQMGLKVRIRKITFLGIDYDAVDCHGFSRGAAVAAVLIYLDKKPGVRKFQVITGKRMHCKKVGEMSEFVINYIRRIHSDVTITPHPTNFGFSWVKRSYI